MKKQIFAVGATAFTLLMMSGCAVLNEMGIKAPELEFKLDKTAGTTYYVSTQKVNKHANPDTSSAVVGSLQMGDTVVAKSIVKPAGHLDTDKADAWIEIDGGYIPSGVLISKEMWEAQLNGLPPRGGVKVKNFTNAKDQDADAALDQAEMVNKALMLILGANGSVKTENGKAYPVQLGNYIKMQNPTANVDIKLPVSKRGILDFPSPKSFVEIGPYQEFDMGAGLAAAMMDKALKPTSAQTVYVKKVVDKLLRNSTLPYAFAGYHVIVLKDDQTINACAAPGGFIFVTTGMLKYLNSEEELAMILAHEIGHIEFHHSVRSFTCVDYAGFAVAAIVAAINLNDPIVKAAILQAANETAAKAPFFDKLPEDQKKAAIEKAVTTTITGLQTAIDEALQSILKVLAVAGEKLQHGHDVEFESAADRRAVSLGAAAGYDAEALLGVLARIKKDNNGFGKAYPANRDELVNTFKANYPVAAKAVPVGDYQAIKAGIDKLTDADLFIKK